MTRSLFEDPPAPDDGARPAPLADRMRPRDLDEVVGQEVVESAGYLRRAMAEDRLPSLILWGPPGTGKTTIARIIAKQVPSRFIPFSAVTSGIKEVREIMAGAALSRSTSGTRTILFVDEIHRFNRAQQDAFLPYVERGDIVLIGATTENPSFQLNAALMSRCRLVVLRALSPSEIDILLRRALADRERGLGGVDLEFSPAALSAIAQLASGDARKALNLLEVAALEAIGRAEARIGERLVSEVAQRKVLLYDRAGEEHFNLISALHKSLRESDPDASIYWLNRMLEAGEDRQYVARRLVRFASEDVGLADPQALSQALSAWDAYERLGSPEGELALVQAVLYLALAPKSNAVYEADKLARQAIQDHPAESVPMALRNPVTDLMRGVGYGEGYVYAHSSEEGVGGMDCLPSAVSHLRFYHPAGSGHEALLARRLEELAERRARASKALRKADQATNKKTT